VDGALPAVGIQGEEELALSVRLLRMSGFMRTLLVLCAVLGSTSSLRVVEVSTAPVVHSCQHPDPTLGSVHFKLSNPVAAGHVSWCVIVLNGIRELAMLIGAALPIAWAGQPYTIREREKDLALTCHCCCSAFHVLCLSCSSLLQEIARGSFQDRA
jgi:hypothetical protein